MGEEISLNSDIEGVVDLQSAVTTLTASLNVTDGEALYDRYYMNLKRNPLALSYTGASHLQKKYHRISRLRLDLNGILPLEIRGLLNPDPSKSDTDLTVTIPPAPLRPIFQNLLQDPYKAEKPFLTALETEGTVSAEFNIKKLQNGWEVVGRSRWHEGKFSLGEKEIFLKGINLDLPVWYRTSLGKDTVKALPGKIEIQSLRIPLLSEQSLSMPLAAGPNRIYVESPTVIGTAGGDLRLGSIGIKELFGPELTLETSLAFEGIKLQPLLSIIGAPPLEGALTGTLDSIRYKKHVATTKGNVSAKVFGGTIVFSQLGVSGILTSAPVVFKLDGEAGGLLLSKMTTDTSFGTIDGVLRGYIHDFEIAAGQPQRFDLLLETIRQNGIPQRISVKAIDNISRIGGGQSPFMGLVGTFTSLFKQFPYEKIGIHAYLENDVFKINGTVEEGGVEYFVKRDGFSGVNIVNQNPDNRISFKDMVERIKRIFRKEGRVVN